MVRRDGLHGLGVLRTAVLDVLRFVEHRRVEGVIPVLLDIAPKQRVAGDHQIVSGDLRKELVALWPGQHENTELGSKARGLSGPVGDQRGGTDNQGGAKGLGARRCIE